MESHPEGHGAGVHVHSPDHRHENPGETPTEYNWRIHHPYEGVENRVAVEIAPWRGLLPRWRFVVPGEFEGVLQWGTGDPGCEGDIDTEGRNRVGGGPVTLTDGPTVVWFGGLEPLSSRRSAYMVFEGDPPHFLAFGQAEDADGPPGELEGITFSDHPPHPPLGDQQSHAH